MGRAMRDRVVDIVLSDDAAFQSLLQLVCKGDRTQRMKGAWVLSGVHARNSQLLQPYRSAMLDWMQKESVGGVKRELLRCFENCDLQGLEKEHLIWIAMQWVTDENQDLAVRYLCNRLLPPLLKDIPELQEELHTQKELYRSKFGRFP